MKQGLLRGLTATLFSEVLLLTIFLLMGNSPLVVITRYARLNQREWAIQILVWLGAFVAGFLNGSLRIPVQLLFLGVAVMPCAMLWTSMDQLSKPSEIQVLYTPALATFVATLPTLLFLLVRAVQSRAGRTGR